MLGKALRERARRRSATELVIATKGGIDPAPTGPAAATASSCAPAWSQSLRKLGVDHIDLYQVHWPDPDTPFGETAGALAELVDEGKIRHVGVSNYDAAADGRVRRDVAGGDAAAAVPPVPPGIEADVLPYARENDIGVLVYSPLAPACSPVRWTSTPPSRTTTGARRPRVHRRRFETNLAVVEDLKAFAAERGVQVSQLAIAWTLHQPGVHVAIVGARSDRNIEASAAARRRRAQRRRPRRIDEIAFAACRSRATPEGVV